MSVTLQRVTAENWRALIKLKVREDQIGFVASNLYSIAESQFGFEEDGHWDLYPFGGYVADEPVGFAMYGFNPSHPRFQGFIFRLMVDEKFQRKGYGRDIMRQVLSLLQGDKRVRNIGISYEPENDVARKFYASLGFVETGEMIGEEVLTVLNLC